MENEISEAHRRLLSILAEFGETPISDAWRTFCPEEFLNEIEARQGPWPVRVRRISTADEHWYFIIQGSPYLPGPKIPDSIIGGWSVFLDSAGEESRYGREFSSLDLDYPLYCLCDQLWYRVVIPLETARKFDEIATVGFGLVGIAVASALVSHIVQGLGGARIVEVAFRFLTLYVGFHFLSGWWNKARTTGFYQLRRRWRVTPGRIALDPLFKG